MNCFFRILIITLILSVAQPTNAAEFGRKKHQKPQNQQQKEVIHLELDANAPKNPVVHNEPDKDVDLEAIEDDLPENNADMYKQTTPLFNNGNFDLDSIFDKNKDNVIDEDTLLGKIIHQKITRTDVPTYLLREELTVRPEKGPIGKMQFFGAYQGRLFTDWQSADNDFGYDYGFEEIGVMGNFRHTKTDFKIMVKPRPNSELSYFQNFVGDAYIVNSSIPHHKIVVGYSRNQIGKEGGSSSYILPFVTRSQIARTFGNTRALGVRLVGSYPLVDYNFALNSSDRFFRSWFPGTEFTGWVDLKPLGKTNGKYGQLIIGGGLNAGHNKTDYAVGSFYAGYKYKKLWTNFEYAIADGYNGFHVSTDEAYGFNYTIGYKIVPQVQLIARYDFFDPNTDIGNNNRKEYTAGINYFIKGQTLRLILNYVYCQNDATPDSHRIIFATQMLL